MLRVHVDCVAAGAPRCHTSNYSALPTIRIPIPANSEGGCDAERVRWPRPNAGETASPSPLEASGAISCQRKTLASIPPIAGCPIPVGVPSPGKPVQSRIVYSCVLGVTASVEELTQIVLGFFREPLLWCDRVVRRRHVGLWGRTGPWGAAFLRVETPGPANIRERCYIHRSLWGTP